MDETFTLILLSLAMLIGCYLAGSIPLAFSFSEEKLKLVTVMGAGLLVGTALAVIIPEGVHTLYESQNAHKMHTHTLAAESVPGAGEEIKLAHELHEGDAAAAVAMEAHDHHDHDSGTEMHSFIGVALVLGFVFMLLVDQFGGSIGHSHGSHTDSELGGGPNNRNKVTATLGLVVHAAADGVALGAAANTSQTHVEMIVFIAIMLHKAPAAFGLVSFLLHDGMDRTRIRKHLGVFSAAAPLLAIITYFSLSQQNKETLADLNATGIAMLFSAGTFLYVATVHILPELAAMGTTRTVSADGSVVIKEQAGFTKCELLLLVTGALLPLLLSIGHHH